MLGRTREKLLSGDNYLKISSLRYLPRWMVFLTDVLIALISLSISYYIIYRIVENVPDFLPLIWRFVIILAVNTGMMYFYKTFSGIVRHSSFIDIQKIFWSSLSTLIILLVFKYMVLFGFHTRVFLTPLLVLYFFVSFVFMVIFRLIVKEAFHYVTQIRKNISKKRILVLGISEAAVSVASAIQDNSSLPFEVMAFLTKRNDSKYAKLLGKKILTQLDVLQKNKEQLQADGVLLIKETLSKAEMNEWVTLFLAKEMEIFQAPSILDFKEETLEKKITNLQIQDLLNREPISIEKDEIYKRHYQKEILITGGAGSIGSELVRQIALFEPSMIVVLDQAETPLYDMELEMKEKFPHINFRFMLADVSNKERLEGVFQKFNFSMVYHAAAYKHVPMIENNPHEAILVNILGTKNAAMLSQQYGINRFVMVSTDKAVNPTNVMGASKRAAELLVQALQEIPGNKTKFITTRFGNVLDSNGSVIPYFKKQIAKGGPVTITHPDIVRYFMTIPEACDLVLQAGSMGKGGEIFVFDMGEPVKIKDLAINMIRLSGLRPNIDIKLTYTGLRPGEKLYEELLSDGSKTLPTPHEKIMVSKDFSMKYGEIEGPINQLIESAKNRDKIEIVKKLKEIVKEYRSSNSVFEALDQTK